MGGRKLVENIADHWAYYYCAVFYQNGIEGCEGTEGGGMIGELHFSGLRKTLVYALYVIVHPFDGFWDLTHENRGSLVAANVITFLIVLVEIFRLTLTNFQFVSTYMEGFNVITVILRVLLPMLLWTTANWSLTTLMDGKGKLAEIYMATAYAFTPYVIVNAVMIVYSQFITIQEGSVYYFFTVGSLIWSILLVLAAMMMIHDYSAGKAIFSNLLTIVAMGVMVCIFLIFFALISDAIFFFVSVFKEIFYRVA
jgi:hypothetical protein